MPNELTVPNLADTIRDKVRQTILATIPDEQVDKLVAKEWESFFEPPTTDRWSSEKKPSEFQKMVKVEVERVVKEKVSEAVAKEMQGFQQNTWDKQGQEAVRTMVKTYASAALEGMTENIVMNCLSRIQANGQHTRVY